MQDDHAQSFNIGFLFITCKQGPCRRFRDDQNSEDTRTFAESFYTPQLRVQGYRVIAQNKNCPSSAFDDRPGRDLFEGVEAMAHFSTGLRRRSHPHWVVSLLRS